MMDCVDVPNDSGNVGKWRYQMPDGTYRRVQGVTATGWISGVTHGKYMDVVPVAASGSSTTHYCDYYSYSGSAGRVVYCGNNNANANGGVSYTNANNDASNANTNVGSRLDNQSSAYITGDVSPLTCREGQASAKAPSVESRNIK